MNYPIKDSYGLWRNERGLIVQADNDSGDSAQRTGMFYYAVNDVDRFRICMLAHMTGFDTLVRDTLGAGFRSDPNEFSRDQQDPIVITSGKYGACGFVRRVLWEHVKRFGRYQNKDWANLQTIGVYVRALRCKWLWPLLCLTDLGLLLQALIIWVRCRNRPDDVDDNNMVMRLAQAMDVLPTPTSYLARKLYVALRPWNYGCSGWKGEANENGSYTSYTSYNGYHPVYGALRWYHRGESGGNPALAEVWRPIVERF